MISVFFYPTDVGKIGIADNGVAITNLYFDKTDRPRFDMIKETELIRDAGFQLQSYLKGELKEFTLPFAPDGTVFMHGVWQALLDIPYGETRSYKEIAQSVGSPKAARAVGLANNRNPLPIFIPCHRVIGANGKLVGYRGGLKMKERLLELEKR